jgi:hypothetical protein
VDSLLNVDDAIPFAALGAVSQNETICRNIGASPSIPYVPSTALRAPETSTFSFVRQCFGGRTRKGYLTRNLIADSETIHRKKMAKRNRRLLGDVPVAVEN